MRGIHIPPTVIPQPRGDVTITMTFDEADQLCKFLGQANVKSTRAHIEASPSNKYGIDAEVFHGEVLRPLFWALAEAVGR